MSDTDDQKVEVPLVDYLQSMEKRLLEDSKLRHENHESVTKANFETFGEKIESLGARVDSVKEHSNTTRWIIAILIAVAVLIISIISIIDL